jgi:acyl-CoA synthetase (AMP-forming)/AMP-acid ligase II
VGSAKLDANSTTKDVGKAATSRYWIVSPADHNKLAPIGATGEILVEGPIIGREYIDEDRSTAAAFIQPPSRRARFGEANDIMRFYKTGDLGQYRVDGTLQLLGRKDTQVKLHGQRIELGEIEHQAWLARGPIKEIVVELVKPRDSSDSEMPMLACSWCLTRWMAMSLVPLSKSPRRPFEPDWRPKSHSTWNQVSLYRCESYL